MEIPWAQSVFLVPGSMNCFPQMLNKLILFLPQVEITDLCLHLDVGKYNLLPTRCQNIQRVPIQDRAADLRAVENVSDLKVDGVSFENLFPSFQSWWMD